MKTEHQSISPTAAKRWIILLAAFINGFVIMSIELLGGRVMAPYFGSSVYVWGSIITVFMLSLSFGYLWGGAGCRLTTLDPEHLFASFSVPPFSVCQSSSSQSH